jgi:RNA polymerase sigma-70 factor, ECF subfamily
MPDQSADITRLLHQWREGNAEAENELFEVVLPELRRLARARMRGERRDHPLQTTELVDQIYIRLVAAKNRDWQNRQHFFAIAGRAMRRYLIDLARSRTRAEVIGLAGLEQVLPASGGKLEFAIAVDQLLDQLEKVNSTWCSLVELKYFLGLRDEEAADVLGVKVRTMQRMWHDARRWLFERMEVGHGEQISS